MHFPRAVAYAQLASILTLFLPVAVWAQGDSLRRIVRRDSLPNGMAIVVVENHNVPLATAEVVFRGGASVQSDELQGVPHLFEHMLFKSYRGRGVRPFGIDANEIDAAYNGATGRETVSYFLSFPAEHAGEALGLLSALVRDPEFTDEDLQRERFVVRGEIQRTHSQPQFLLADASDRLLWGAFFPRVNTGGDDLSMFSVKKDQLKGFLRTWYVPNNAALVVTGDVKADRVLSMARAAFGDWKRQGDPLAAHPVPAPPPLDSIRAVVLTADVTTVTITMSWRAPGVRSDPRGSRDAVALADVMNDEASRFHRKLVDGGAFQAVSIAYNGADHAPALTFTGVTTPEKAGSALTALSSQILSLADSDYFDDHGLLIARKQRRVTTALAFEHAQQLALLLGEAWATSGLDYLLREDDELAMRRPADLRSFASRFVTGKPYVVGVLAPAGPAPAIGRMLAQFNELLGPP